MRSPTTPRASGALIAALAIGVLVFGSGIGEAEAEAENTASVAQNSAPAEVADTFASLAALAVPEPGTLLLSILGGTALLVRRRSTTKRMRGRR